LDKKIPTHGRETPRRVMTQRWRHVRVYNRPPHRSISRRSARPNPRALTSSSTIFVVVTGLGVDVTLTHRTKRAPRTRCNLPPLVSAPARSRRPARRSSRGASASVSLARARKTARRDEPSVVVFATKKMRAPRLSKQTNIRRTVRPRAVERRRPGDECAVY